MWFVGTRQPPYRPLLGTTSSKLSTISQSITSLLSLLLSFPRALTATLSSVSSLYQKPSDESVVESEFEMLDLNSIGSDEASMAAAAEIIWKRLHDDAVTSDLLSLDPHYVQVATSAESLQSLPQSSQQIEQHPSSSYHSQYVHHLRATDLDPSLCLAFYCRDEADFLDFFEQAARVDSSLAHSVFALFDEEPAPINDPPSAAQSDGEDFVML